VNKLDELLRRQNYVVSPEIDEWLESKGFGKTHDFGWNEDCYKMWVQVDYFRVEIKVFHSEIRLFCETYVDSAFQWDDKYCLFNKHKETLDAFKNRMDDVLRDHF